LPLTPRVGQKTPLSQLFSVIIAAPEDHSDIKPFG
jgi:hypothetical protein